MTEAEWAAFFEAEGARPDQARFLAAIEVGAEVGDVIPASQESEA